MVKDSKKEKKDDEDQSELGVLDKTKLYFTRAYYSMMGSNINYKNSIEPIYKDVKAQLGIVEEKKQGSQVLKKIGKQLTDNVFASMPVIDTKDWKVAMEDDSDTPISEKITCVLNQGPGSSKEYTKIDETKLFENVLVANRGEIAIRIIRACKELGIKTTVIHSKHDSKSLAVQYADDAYCLDDYEGKVANGYLDAERIVKIAKIAKIDALHPGYGFLSESVELAKLCEENDIKFIGPHSDTIHSLGDKAIAKNTMTDNDIPVVEGSDSLETAEEALEFAKKIGFPVIAKAAEGGGGKGMRIVKKEKKLISSYNSAKAEAKAAFNSERVFVEKYIEKPHHIEFQILADQYGNVVHFGERDCSIQRRHQKLIEEAPSPALDEKLREKMGKVAIRAAEAVGYEGVGTVEFLLDANNDFYFMEMNTRIQVEHGITEIITGVDLVKEQIMVAAGARIAYKQEDIQINGWAIECRINAEDPLEDFKPCPGKIADYLPPGGPGVRVCSCAHTGFEISPFYDSMIAKLIIVAQNRNDAIDRMQRALDEYTIKGLMTTIPFHKVVIKNKNFRKGRVTTDFIEKNSIIETIEKENKKAFKKDKIVAIIGAGIAAYLKEKNGINLKKPKKEYHNNWVLASRIENMSSMESGDYDDSIF